MDQQQALQTLVNGIRLAQKRGAFEMEESEVLIQAIRAFKTGTGELSPEEKPEEVEEEDKTAEMKVVEKKPKRGRPKGSKNSK